MVTCQHQPLLAYETFLLFLKNLNNSVKKQSNFKYFELLYGTINPAGTRTLGDPVGDSAMSVPRPRGAVGKKKGF